jgi:hypothetical protein
MSINIRAGWTMKSVEKTYFKYEKAGDQYVGRTVAGLPIHSVNFAILPPSWKETENAQAIASGLVDACFPNAHEKLRGVCSQLLASVVYHVDWLREKLPATHHLFTTTLFTGYRVDELLQYVECNLPQEDQRRATGVPAHVSLKLQVHALQRQQDDTLLAVTAFRNSFESILREGLNDHATSQGHMTFDKFNEVMNDKFSELSEQLARSINGGHTETRMDIVEDDDDDEEEVHASQYTMYAWGGGGKLHLVPQSFSLPTKATTPLMFQQWASGNSEKRYPPLRMLNPDDIPKSNERKRFSDLKTFFLQVESVAKSAEDPQLGWPTHKNGDWKHILTNAEAREVWANHGDVISVATQTEKGRSRRITQMAWTTQHKEWAKKRRKKPKATPAKRKRRSNRRTATQDEQEQQHSKGRTPRRGNHSEQGNQEGEEEPVNVIEREEKRPPKKKKREAPAGYDPTKGKWEEISEDLYSEYLEYFE